jgi:hypothetical protein
MGFKRPGNSKAPCRMCYLTGQRAPSGTTYYIPHNGNCTHLPFRRDSRADIRDVVNSNSAEMQTEYGIVRKSILTKLRSIHFPRSFPIDIMHCVLQNITPMLYNIWSGNMAGLNQDDELPLPAYRMANRTLQGIGELMINARRNIPSALGHAPRNIEKYHNGFKAAEWKAWLTMYGIPCLTGHLPEPYLQNFVTLSHLFMLATQHTLSNGEVDKVGQLAELFVTTYEDLYYGGRCSNLKVCTVNIHYLLHLRKHIFDNGPACYWWQFPMERYCGVIVPMARSKVHLAKSLMNALLVTTQLSHYDFLYPTVLRETPTQSNAQLTNPFTSIANKRTIHKRRRWDTQLRQIHARVDEEVHSIEYFLKCQLTPTLSTGSEIQTRHPPERANFVVCYKDNYGTGIGFGEVQAYALVNNVDAWALIEPLGPTPVIDHLKRTCLYSTEGGKKVWKSVTSIRSAGGVVVRGNKFYCVTDVNIYN